VLDIGWLALFLKVKIDLRISLDPWIQQASPSGKLNVWFLRLLLRKTPVKKLEAAQDSNPCGSAYRTDAICQTRAFCLLGFTHRSSLEINVKRSFHVGRTASIPPEIVLKIYFTDRFVLPLPDGHRFPMTKYRKLRDRLIASPVHFGDVFLEPPAASSVELKLAHDSEYVDRVFEGNLTQKELKRIGFPWSPEMVQRSCRSSGATLAAARVALREAIAVNLAGGTHHAMRGAGEGYCVFNDSAVAIRTLMHEGNIKRACVIDCDVHQGNGTAQILGQETDVFTFSIHCAKNFPARKFPSHLDIDLEEGIGDLAYLSKLEQGLAQVMAAGPYDLAIYLAGADPYVGDRLGRLALSKEGLRMRDRLVLDVLNDHQIPIAVAMAGGYAPNVDDIVDIHAMTVHECARIASMYC
jgi:acetoin utilization deacetylase AcuC-like enzyme